MEFTIATINDILLPPFLFIVFFCAVSVFLSVPERQPLTTQSEVTRADSQQATKQPQALAPPTPFPLPASQQQSNQPVPLSQEMSNLNESPVESPQSSVPSLEELLEGIDLDKLPLRKARKIASRLGIKQKVNQRAQPLSWLRAQIKKRLTESSQPQAVARVIRELAS